MSLATCRFHWHYKFFFVTCRFPDITKYLLFNTWVFSDNTKGLVIPEWWGLCGIMSTGWRLTLLNRLSLLIIDKAQPICTWSPENKEKKMSCRIWCCWEDDCKDLLVDNVLMSSEQYFSYIQDKKGSTGSKTFDCHWKAKTFCFCLQMEGSPILSMLDCSFDRLVTLSTIFRLYRGCRGTTIFQLYCGSQWTTKFQLYCGSQRMTIFQLYCDGQWMTIFQLYCGGQWMTIFQLYHGCQGTTIFQLYCGSQWMTIFQS